MIERIKQFIMAAVSIVIGLLVVGVIMILMFLGPFILIGLFLVLVTIIIIYGVYASLQEANKAKSSKD